MNKIILSFSFFFLVACSSIEDIQVETKVKSFKVPEFDQIKRPELNYYHVDFLQYEDTNFKCFDKDNTDLFNENYYNLQAYIEKLEAQNKLLKETIKDITRE